MMYGNSANFLFLKDGTVDRTSTEASLSSLSYPPASKMDFGPAKMKTKIDLRLTL